MTSSSRFDGGGGNPFAVVASTKFESGPPVSKIKQVDDDDADILETVKEEEWEERRKKTTTKTRNVERRVQRQLVLEDGEVVGDSGPVVTEDATEDTVTKEDVSDLNQRPEGQLSLEPPPGEGWVSGPGAVVISEKCTKTTQSHDEVEDEIETEEIQHCGNVTNQEAEKHIRGEADLRKLTEARQSSGWELAKPEKRIVHESTRRRGNVDTTDVKETSKIQDGHVVTETERTVRQEHYDNESLPDSGSSLSDGSVHEKTKETSHNLVHTKDEDLLEYYAVPKGGSLAQGVKIGEGMHVVSEDVHEDRQGDNDANDAGDSAVDRHTRTRVRPSSRRDALTKRPLNYDLEEKTRKTETNKWLEHHFGSESGRSEDSIHDPEDQPDSRFHSSGGNRITITMSPHPATNDDSGLGIHAPKAPPPPPPKPERLWNLGSTERSSSPAHSRPAHDIHGSELAAARSRLRSTGLSLTEENKENNAPDERSSYSTQFASMGHSGNSVYSSRNHQPPPVPEKPSEITALKEDVIYSSKFRSGKPKGKAPGVPAPQIPLLTPPPSITSVGRSQSFHVQTMPWSSKKREAPVPFKSSMKDYRSEERLDNLSSRRTTSYPQKESYNSHHSQIYTERSPSHWQHSSWSPPREPTPPPPPRQSRRTQVTKSYSNLSSNSGREVATQTGVSPVPPPRTKRKKRPKSSYFFGDNDFNSSTYSSRAKQNGPTSRYRIDDPYNTHSNSIDQNNHFYKDTRHRSEKTYHSSSSSRQSPKAEKRYKTTKTITPVIVVPYENSRPEKYHQSAEYVHSTNRSSWTNTVDPRRRPRVTSIEERSTTLPRKLQTHHKSSSNSHPKKTYLFGETDSSSNEAHQPVRNYDSHRGSMHNISSYQTESHVDYNNRYTSLNNRINNKSSKPVGRSHSFNVHAGMPNAKPMVNGRPLSEISSEQKSSRVYGSSPYVNLQSPNLIATIARSSSTRRTDSNEEENTDLRHDSSEEKRELFMKGLLNTAPELFHFIHGSENETNDAKSNMTHERNSPPSSGNRRSKPAVDISSSPYSPPTNSKSPTYSARVFTFGKGDNNTITRMSSQGLTDKRSSSIDKENYYNNHNNNTYSTEKTTTTYSNNRVINQNNNNRRSTFNLKTSGSSLLYSPSFRNQQQQESEERRRSRESSVGKERLSGEFGVSGMHGGGSPVIVQVRDWNTR